MNLLNKIQQELKVPKGQYNSFAKYNYRNAEDILEAVKPMLGDEALLTLSDEIVQVGDRYYIKATATFTEWAMRSQVKHQPLTVSVTAYAREALDKKGMDEAQITGAASSYARKYALNGLFCIDDTKDADSHEPVIQTEAKPAAKPLPPKAVVDKTNAQKKRIQELCDAKTLVPLIDGEDYKKYIFDNVTLELVPANYSAIIERLEAMQ